MIDNAKSSIRLIDLSASAVAVARTLPPVGHVLSYIALMDSNLGYHCPKVHP
jgi:hypothetical protein